MLTTMGSLSFDAVTDRLDLVAPSVARALRGFAHSPQVGVAAIDPSLSDTAAFCEHYGMTLSQAANCVIVEGKSGADRAFAAVVLLASTRADINGAVRGFLQAKKVSFAQMEKAVAESGMEFGAITPIGLPSSWPILVDERVAQSGYVVIGAGLRSSKIAIEGSVLAQLPGVTLISGLANPRELE
jgi:prolyl-tRNA editing enzyme YbaK/EbsC (Cys-tRNA(Pro) deacylase)